MFNECVFMSILSYFNIGLLRVRLSLIVYEGHYIPSLTLVRYTFGVRLFVICISWLSCTVEFMSITSHHIISCRVISYHIRSHHVISDPTTSPQPPVEAVLTGGDLLHIRELLDTPSHHTTSHCHMTWHDITSHPITTINRITTTPSGSRSHRMWFASHSWTPRHPIISYHVTSLPTISPYDILSPQPPVETVLTRSNLLHIRELLDTPSAQISPKPALLASPPRSLGRHISYMGEQIYV